MNWITIAHYISVAWAAVGPIIGVLVGALLTRSWDKQKWMNDNRKEECRELLTAISEAAVLELKRILSVNSAGLRIESGASLQVVDEAYTNSLKVFQDRIFIA